MCSSHNHDNAVAPTETNTQPPPQIPPYFDFDDPDWYYVKPYIGQPRSRRWGSTSFSDDEDIVRVIVAGGKSERKVWDTVELRIRILGLVGKRDLAKMLRLHKASTASIAGLLYREIHTSIMSKMSRANARRSTYCDAVRVLDRSPHADVTDSDTFYEKKKTTGVRFDPTSFLKIAKAARKKYPNLHRILYQYPKYDVDDAYVADFDGDNIVLHLESHVFYDEVLTERPGDWPPALPPTPTYEGMEVHHTIALKRVTEKWDMRLNLFPRRGEEWKQRMADTWTDWLFRNPHLDKRIVKIDVTGTDVHESPRGLPSVDELLHFLAQRKRDGCEPPINANVQTKTAVTAERFHEILAGLNPEIRSLIIHQSLLESLPNPKDAILALSAALPSLHNLTIESDSWRFLPQLTVPHTLPLEDIPFSAFPRLRKLDFRSGRFEDSNMQARYLSRIGSAKCVYQDENIYGMAKKRRFSKWVQESKQLKGDDFEHHYYHSSDEESDEDGGYGW